MATYRDLIIGMLGLILAVVSGVLGLAFRYGKIVNEVRNLAESSKRTADAIDRHINWHMGRFRS